MGHDILLKLKEFELCCFFWSLYGSNDIRNMLYEDFANELNTRIRDLVNHIQGREGVRLNFLNKTFSVRKFDRDVLNAMVQDLEKAIAEDSMTSAMYRDILDKVLIFQGKLYRSGRLDI